MLPRKHLLATDASLAELPIAKIARTGELLSQEMVQLITALEQSATEENIRACLHLLYQAPTDEANALVNWTYGFKLISRVSCAQSILNYLNTNADYLTKLCQTLLACLKALAKTEPNLFVYQEVTLGWSVAVMLATLKHLANKTQQANNFIEALHSWLIDYSSQLNWNSSSKCTILWLLCHSQEWDIVKMLLAGNQDSDWNKSPDTGPCQGKSALWYLCNYQRWEEIKILLIKGIELDWNRAPVTGPGQGISALWYLCNYQRWEEVNVLLTKGIELDWNAAPVTGPYQNMSALLWLCANQRWEEVNFLLNKGVELDWNRAPVTGPGQGVSALWYLCNCQRWEEINILLTKDIELDWNAAPVTETHQGRSALWYLCALKRWEEVNILLTKGIELDWNSAPVTGPGHGISALRYLCNCQRWEEIKILLTKGVELDWNSAPVTGSGQGVSALWNLCNCQRWEEIKILLTKGIELDWNSAPVTGSGQGRSAFWYLCNCKRWEEVKILLTKGIELDWNIAPNEGDKKGQSALWGVCHFNQWDLVSSCLAAESTLELIQSNILELLLKFPLFTLWQERIKYHLYTSQESEITLNLPTLTEQQRAFLQEVVAQHPYIITIHVGTLSLTRQQQNKAADSVKWVLAACKELKQAIAQEKLYIPAELPTSFINWQDNLAALENLAAQSGYVEHALHDYLTVLIRFLDACVRPKIVEIQLAIKTIEQASAEEASHFSEELKQIAADKENFSNQPAYFCQFVLALINHAAVTQLSWQAQANIQEVAYHCLLIEGIEASSYQALVYRSCYCYQKAAEQYQVAAQYAMEILQRAYYQKQANKLLAAKQQLAEMCQNQLLEAAGLGFGDKGQELKMTETEQLIQTFYQQLQITTARPLLQQSTKLAITVAELFNYLIQTYYQTPTVVQALQQIQEVKARTIQQPMTQANYPTSIANAKTITHASSQQSAPTSKESGTDARSSTQQDGGSQAKNYPALFSPS